MKDQRIKKWQRGDLVLHEDHPKTHAMLMEIVDIKPGHAKTVFLAPPFHEAPGKNHPAHDTWHPLDKLHDPVRFLKTQEFLETLRARSLLRPSPPGDNRS